MKLYTNSYNQELVEAEVERYDSDYYMLTATDPGLPAGTVITAKDEPDAPAYTISAASGQANGKGPWFAQVEPLLRDYSVSYSFLTFTHSTIAGSMVQSAATAAEAASQVREWLSKIYRPVEIDHVTPTLLDR